MRRPACAATPRYPRASTSFAYAKAWPHPEKSLGQRPIHTGRASGEFKRLKRLTVPRAKDYIALLGRTAALARWRVREAPHCLYGESSGHDPWPCRMCGYRRLRFLPETVFRRSLNASGCLTSESEERETWTAESLRTASPNGMGFGLFREEGGHWKRLWRSTFKVTLWSFRRAIVCVVRVGPRQTCDLPESISSNLRV